MCTAILKKMCNFAACNQANEKKPLMKNNGEIADLVEKWLKGHNL